MLGAMNNLDIIKFCVIIRASLLVHQTILSQCGLPPPPNFRLVLAFFLLAPAVASAQDTDPLLQFQLERKNPTTAALYEFLLPFLGTGYAGDWQKSIVPFGVQLAGVAGWITSALVAINCTSSLVDSAWDDPWDDDLDFGCLEGGFRVSRAIAWTGTAFFLGGGVWRILRARGVAERFNQNLRQRLGIALTDVDLKISPAPGGMSIGVSIPIGR